MYMTVFTPKESLLCTVCTFLIFQTLPVPASMYPCWAYVYVTPEYILRTPSTEQVGSVIKSTRRTSQMTLY